MSVNRPVITADRLRFLDWDSMTEDRSIPHTCAPGNCVSNACRPTPGPGPSSAARRTGCYVTGATINVDGGFTI